MATKFTCRYLLIKYCQLFSRPCDTTCEYFGDCQLCYYRDKSRGTMPCLACHDGKDSEGKDEA